MTKNERILITAALVEANRTIALLDEEVRELRAADYDTIHALPRDGYVVTSRDRSRELVDQALTVIYERSSFWQRVALGLETFAASLRSFAAKLGVLIEELEQDENNGKGKRL